ncbi:MAG: hypothetical protein PVG23_04450 [Nitrosopumilaceae archaeon]|jgi:hypothetical protein
MTAHLKNPINANIPQILKTTLKDNFHFVFSFNELKRFEKISLVSFVVLLFTIASEESFALEFTAISDGPWQLDTTWDIGDGMIPGAGDSAIIPHDRAVSSISSITVSSIQNSGTLDFPAAQSVTIQSSLVNDGTINLNNGAGTVSINFQNDAPLSGTGVINRMEAGKATFDKVGTTTQPLVLPAGHTLNVMEGTMEPIRFGDFINNGQITVGGILTNATLNLTPANTLTNYNTISASGSSSTITWIGTGGQTLIQNGTLQATSGALLNIRGGTIQNGQLFSGNDGSGEITISDISPLRLDSVTIHEDATVEVTTSTKITIENTLQNNGLIKLNNPSGTSSLSFEDDATLNGTGGVITKINDGISTIDQVGSPTSALVFPAGHSLNVLGGTMKFRFGNHYNNGQVLVGVGSTLDISPAKNFTNTNSISVSGSGSTINWIGTGGQTLIQNGTLQATDGGLINISGGTIANGEFFTGSDDSGEIILFGISPITLDNVSINQNATVEVTTAGTIRIKNTLQNNGVINLNNPSGTRITFMDDATLTGTGGVINKNEVGDDILDQALTGTHPLIHPAGHTMNILNGTMELIRFGDIINNGTILVDAGATLDLVSDMNNTGAIQNRQGGTINNLHTIDNTLGQIIQCGNFTGSLPLGNPLIPCNLTFDLTLYQNTSFPDGVTINPGVLLMVDGNAVVKIDEYLLVKDTGGVLIKSGSALKVADLFDFD